MTDVEIGVSAYQVGSAHPNTRYGRPALLRLATSSGQPGWQVLLRASMAGIPDGATVSSAVLRFFQHSDIASHDFDLRRSTSWWNSKVTWNDRPTYTDPVVSVTSAGAGAHAAVDFDVTATAQQIVSGAVTDRGWLLSRTDAGVPIGLEGTPSSDYPPVMLVSYTLEAQTPDNLSPTGVVSIAAPTLTFDVDDDVLSVQVQMDPDANESAPAFDSGEVASTGGYLDLSTTTYAGLADGASTQWRVRQKNALGWSDWSDWMSFSRITKGTATLTAPTSGTVSDGTPPVEWSFTGTQTAWRARLVDATGKILSDSGRTAGIVQAWTPEKGLTKDGQTGKIIVNVWDDVDREATPGDPTYATVALALTLTPDSTVAPMDTLSADGNGAEPSVGLTGTRAEVPDEVIIIRDGVRIARLTGTDVFTGTAFTWTDWTCDQDDTEHTWRVAPVVNSKTASAGPTATAKTKCRGTWLIDADGLDDADPNPARVVFWAGESDVEQTDPEIAITHQPITGNAPAVIRRRLVRLPAQGSVKGPLTPKAGFEDTSGQAAAATLRAFADNDAGHLYRVVQRGVNHEAIIGDLVIDADASFNWWAR